ncbi:phospholipase C, phosphocholine-specific [Paracidovorax avenae]|uniref:phosphocholine-specific phospholipase C n=1 Tax=Paracidovorax avenae TaxID=80867 RepID=UPI000D16FE16|nr:phospholipase C, phosphocholine-specific [Paracidovorax avenae]AVS70037.1 phospholipase C, phosphocholine-specific [Paracidovorax avenae]
MTLDPSKRKFLQAAAGTTAGAAALGLFPPSIRRALAIPANRRTGTIKDVEHVVILMQENRSFDHYFGTLAGVRGFGDRFTIPLPGGRSVWQQADQNGQTVLPYHLNQAAGNAQRVDGTPHSWEDARDAWDRGRMAEWPRYKQPQSMGYYTQAEASFQFALANAFTVCDAYFCSLHGGTNTNRLFHWTGTNGPTGPAGQVVVDNAWDALYSDTDIRTGGYDWITYPERLQQAGVSWMVYQNMPDNFTDNPLVGFRQYRQANLASGKPVYSDSDANPAYDPARDQAGNPLYKGIANTMPDGGFLGTFRQAVLHGRLPQVSWIIPPATYCEHPGPSSPVQGGWYVQEVLDALTANPEVWSKTVLLINFDENDGYFDHVPPPCAPSLDGRGGTLGKSTLSAGEMAYEYYTHKPYADTGMPPPDGDCYGPGPRVPMWVVSPWSRGGWVNSQNFDHTSVLRFLEARFGVKEPQISPYRRAVFGDLTSAFNFATPNDAPLATLAGRRSKGDADALCDAQGALPQIAVPSPQALPRQATGTRPSRALPYELHVRARTHAAGGTVQLGFSNTGTAAAVFHVYDRLHLDRAPRRYMVEAGKQLHDHWSAGADGGAYDLWVLGPNGFHRSFAGNLAALRGAVPHPEADVCYDIANGNAHLVLMIMNQGSASAALQVKSNAYRGDGPWTTTVAPGQSQELQWDLSGSAHWYDFTLTCDALPGFARRFAGRVETGRDGLSDPAMGLAG